MNDRPIHHVCYIVDDIPEAVDQWSRRPAPAPSSTWASTSSSRRRCWRESPACSITPRRFGKWGRIFLELIELHEVTPELESRFYTGGAGGSNIAHIGYIVDDAAAERERLEAAGMPKFLHLRQGPIQISLHDAPLLGHAIEVHENTDAINGLFALFAAGAEGWDGSEPLREMPEG